MSDSSEKKLIKNNPPKRLKVCLAFSPGGHCQQALQILDAFEDCEVFYASNYSITTKDLKGIYFLKEASTPRRALELKCMISNMIISLKMLLKEQPDVIVTTGAQVAMPICYLSKLLFAKKIIFIESFCRVTSRSLTGKVIYPISDIFLVQWESLLRLYGKKAIYVGKVY
jgi:beta-1,4-N-acetylglucosaminyltransferase